MTVPARPLTWAVLPLGGRRSRAALAAGGEPASGGASSDDARLRAAQELTGLGWWTLDVATGHHEWSDAMFRLVGLEPAAQAPDHEQFLDLLHPDDRPAARDLATEGFATGHREIFRVLHPDGSVRFLQSWTDVETDSAGQVVRVLGATIDVTDQAEAAARLATSEEHFRVAFENAPIGMSMISLEPGSLGVYLRSNRAFQEMTGYSQEELAGREIMDITHPADRDRDETQFRRLATGEVSSVAFEKRFRCRDGSAKHAWLTSSVVHGSTGEPLYLVTHAVDITDRLREQAELERLALTDTLTGLANRTLLTDRMDQALARLQRTGGTCAMLLVDVDRFKLVNDSLGHQTGDALLVEMAGRIEAVSRADSTVARLGGDEFVVLVEGLREVDEVHAIVGRLLDALRRPYHLGPAAESFVATASIGISVATSPDRSHVDLYREADLALYRAKDSGRDQYALFDDALRSRADARMRAETLLRAALAEDMLVPVFQPVVDLADGRVTAVEGLARIAADGALIPPADFVDVAEETGLIVELDARMFELVAREYARLAEVPGTSLSLVSTNVSARSLEDPAFVDRLRRALTWYGVPGSAIRIELTERSLLTTKPAVRESLERMATLGIDVGLDDFGTGYSALAYLQRFSLQFLKIDRSFVGRLGGSSRDDAVVAAVVDLAHAHGLTVVAEGVETPEQLAAVRRMGCDRAQGYLLGKPMRSDELEALLRADPRW